MLSKVLSGPAQGSRHTSVGSRVEFITDDVAIVDGEAILEGLAATDRNKASSLTHRFTDLVVKQNGRWAMAHVRAYALSGPVS